MKIAVIGAGAMGSGIAQTFAAAEGYEVLLCDITEERAAAGKQRIADGLKRQVEKEKMSEAAAEEMLQKISTGLPEQAGDCELIEEAAIENVELKKALFAKLQGFCRKDAIFCSNTSSLSLTELSRGLDRPVVGMHFFNPAPVMKLVEVIAGIGAPSELIDRVMSIAEDIGKTPIKVKDSAGFAVNRILVPMINEGIAVYAENIASAQDIDTALKLGANHPLGPLELGDLVGLDVCLAIMEVLHAETGDPKYRPHPLMRNMVRAGLLGRKSGRGFYDYH